MTTRTALDMATRGGARVLGRDDIGMLSPGMAADFAAFRLDTIDMSGAWDPVAALVLCGPHKASCTVVNGRPIVHDGRLVSLDLAPVLARHAALARALANGEG